MFSFLFLFLFNTFPFFIFHLLFNIFPFLFYFLFGVFFFPFFNLLSILFFPLLRSFLWTFSTSSYINFLSQRLFFLFYPFLDTSNFLSHHFFHYFPFTYIIWRPILFRIFFILSLLHKPNFLLVWFCSWLTIFAIT